MTLVLCALGWHRWRPLDAVDCVTYERGCARCGRRQLVTM